MTYVIAAAASAAVVRARYSTDGQGWQTRWAKYSNNQFQEGVSLTCADELSRWQKYGWGCS
jgi:hypothetical protein